MSNGRDQKRANDTRPTVRSALSPRVPPARLTSNAPAYRSESDPTAGRHGDTSARRPKRNTLRNTRHGGASVHKYVPAELAREALTSPSAPTAAPTRGLPYNVTRSDFSSRPTRDQAVSASQSGRLRQRAMTDHSVMTRNGAVATTTVLMRTGSDDPFNSRTIPVTVPIWADDPTEQE
jgi:hypothetical protein